MESDRKSARSAGNFLVVCSFLYGILSLVGGMILATKDESGCDYRCDKPYIAYGIAVAFIGVFIAATTYAIGQYIVFKSSAESSAT